MATHFFGQRWDAPELDDAVQVATPIGTTCLYCGEPILDGDRGLVQPCARTGPDGNLVGSVEPLHMECHLRSIVGDVAHLEGRCSCYGRADPQVDRSYREEALAVLAHINAERAGQGLPPM